jgi:hypothetical protein
VAREGATLLCPFWPLHSYIVTTGAVHQQEMQAQVEVLNNFSIQYDLYINTTKFSFYLFLLAKTHSASCIVVNNAAAKLATTFLPPPPLLHYKMVALAVLRMETQSICTLGGRVSNSIYLLCPRKVRPTILL